MEKTVKKYHIAAATWIVISLALAGLYFFQDDPTIQDIKNKAEDLITEELQNNISTPSPLRGPLDNKDTLLTQDGIVEWTNTHRAEAGISPLAVNDKLNTSAKLKAQDMLERQYFEHETPTGENVDDFANTAGYNYILIGENLALGNFDNDKALVQAWMDSPGHRDNILHDNYTEIGIGIIRGDYEGNEVWLAVQHFGKPKSACPEIDNSLLTRIERNKDQIDAWEIELDQRKEDINNTPRDHPSYNRKVREYNDLVERYNALSKETKILVGQYNEQVQSFNQCANS